MSCQWYAVSYLTEASQLERLLPTGFSLRGQPVVTVHLAHFRNLYWLAGRGYGIVVVDFPVIYQGRTETIVGTFCAAMWEGIPDAVMTGREELGFPKLFADIAPVVSSEAGTKLSGHATWFGHRFLDLEVHGLTETTGDKALPGGGGAAMYFKYLPNTSVGGAGGADVAYVTTSHPPPGTSADPSPVRFGDFSFRKWKGEGTTRWHRATFEQLPTTFHIVNGLADLNIVEYVGAEMIEFEGPGIGVSAGLIRAVEPAEVIRFGGIDQARSHPI